MRAYYFCLASVGLSITLKYSFLNGYVFFMFKDFEMAVVARLQGR